MGYVTSPSLCVCVSAALVFTSQVHPDLSRQLLQDGYRLDEIPDDEDLDLIPPKAMGSSVCCCFDSPSCSMQWSWCCDSNPLRAWFQPPALNLVSGAWSLLSRPGAAPCCTRTSSSEHKLLFMQDTLKTLSTHGTKKTNKQKKTYIRTSLIHCDPKAWRFFFFFFFYRTM